MLKQAAGLMALLLIMVNVLAGAPVCIDGVCTYEPDDTKQLTVYLLACECAERETVSLLSDFFGITPLRELPESIPAGAFLITGGGECSAKKTAGIARNHLLTLHGKAVLYRDHSYLLSQQENLEELKRAMKATLQDEE